MRGLSQDSDLAGNKTCHKHTLAPVTLSAPRYPDHAGNAGQSGGEGAGGKGQEGRGRAEGAGRRGQGGGGRAEAWFFEKDEQGENEFVTQLKKLERRGGEEGREPGEERRCEERGGEKWSSGKKRGEKEFRGSAGVHPPWPV